jgi:isochorismate synthase
MMDTLLFRFPGSEKNDLKGTFSSLDEIAMNDSDQKLQGFIFSNFENTACHLFSPNFNLDEPSSKLHFNSEKPLSITKEDYLIQAQNFLKEIQNQNIGKAILSRVKEEKFDNSKTFALYHQLCESYPEALVYLVSSKMFGTWIGASPEVLAETDDGILYTMALAGTKKNAQTEWTEKEMEEHALVSDFIVDKLKSFELDNIESVGPFEYEAGPVTHLRTNINAELLGKSPWAVAKSLHPSPAVSGMPRKEALKLIEKTEKHQRDLYAGILGVLDAETTRLFVNLRCAQIQENEIYLYVGGGYTAQSIPLDEWNETENKSKTLLNVLNQIKA